MKQSPSMDQWLAEAKADESAPRCGMYLAHNGTVRELPKKLVREGVDDGTKVTGMNFGSSGSAHLAGYRIRARMAQRGYTCGG